MTSLEARAVWIVFKIIAKRILRVLSIPFLLIHWVIRWILAILVFPFVFVYVLIKFIVKKEWKSEEGFDLNILNKL